MTSDASKGTLAHPSQRVGVFVDVQNVYHSSKHLYGARVNFGGLIREAVAGRHLVRAVAYVVRSETGVEESFFDALRKTGLELREKNLQVYADGVKKADWDVGMAVDVIRMANFLDTIALVTGDGDFVPLVEYVKWGLGRQVEVYGFEKTTSSRLREAADRFVALDDVQKILLRRRV